MQGISDDETGGNKSEGAFRSATEEGFQSEGVCGEQPKNRGRSDVAKWECSAAGCSALLAEGCRKEKQSFKSKYERWFGVSES